MYVGARRWSRRATACMLGAAVLLLPVVISAGVASAAQSPGASPKAPETAAAKPSKPKPTKPRPAKPKPVTAPRTCMPAVAPKPRPKPVKPKPGTSTRSQAKPSKPSKRPKPTKPSKRPLRGCPAPGKTVPTYVPAAVASELGDPAATGGDHGWAQLAGSLAAASTFTSPTGRGSTSIRMLDAPTATRTDYENGAAYVAGSFTAVQVFHDRSMKESIVVPRRLGSKTWSWQLASSGALRPRITPSGGVDLRNGLYIPPPKVTAADGSRLSAPAVWTLAPDGVLSLTTNDRSYPLPYIVDPGVAPTGAFTGFSSTTGNTYIDPNFSLTRIFINNSQSGRFTVNASVNDPDDALQTRVCFPTFGAGWIQDGGCVSGGSGTSNAGLLATYYSGSTTGNLAAYPGGAFTTTNYGSNPGLSSCANQPGSVGPFNRVEPTIDSYANWGVPGVNDDSPYNELCNERFSARWQGTVRTPNEADASDTYYFSTISDDGIRVTVNGVVVLADWGEHGASWRTSCGIVLSPNQVYSITVDYFENGSNNRAQMRWSVPGATGRPPAATLCQTNDAARDKYLRFSATNSTVWYPTGQTTTATSNGTAPASWPVVPAAPTATDPGLRMPSNSFARTYEWTAGAAAPPSSPQNVVFEDEEAPDPTPGTAPFTVIADSTGPSGGSISVSAPAGGGLTTSTTGITLTWNANGTSDGAVGLTSGIAGTGSIWRQDVPFDNGNDTCDAFPAWTSTNSTVVRTDISTTASVNNDATLAADVVSGRCYRWALVFTDNVGNVGAEQSQVLRVDATPPAAVPPTFTPVTGAQWMHVAGTTVFYNNAGANTGSITVDGSSLDLESGLDSLRFPPIGPGWSPGGATNDTAAPFSQTYTWNSSSVGATGLQLRARDVAGNVSNGPAFQFTPDVTPPTGGAITYADGVWGSTSYTVGFTVGGDGSGAGVGTWQVERRETTLQPSGTCDPFVAGWTPVGSASPAGSTLPDSIVGNHCYMYRLVVTDLVGNSQTYTSTNVLRFDEQPPVAAFYDLTETSGSLYRVPLTNQVWFNPTSAGGFRIRATATDAIGMDRVAFPTLGSSGWTGPSPTDILAPSGDYWVSSPYAWSAGAADPVGPHQIVARDSAGNTTPVPFEVDSDSTSPSGGLASLPNILTNAATVTVTMTAATDTQSGMRDWSIDVQTAPLTNGSCGAWGGWVASGISGVGVPPASSSYPTSATGCYRARLISTDNVGNVEVGAASTNVLRVDLGNPSVAFTAPADNSNQTGTFSFTGTGSESQSSLASVSIGYAGPATGTACAAATLTAGTPGAWTWSCSWAAGALPDGLYTLTATATDAVGNTGTSVVWHYRLDNQAPTANWVSWTESSTGLHAGTGADRDLLWYNPLAPADASGTATATVSATDAGSGMNRVDFPALAAAGWGPGGSDTTATGTDYSHGYTFTGGGAIGDPASAAATAFDNAGGSRSLPDLAFRIEPDGAAPTGSTFTMPAALQSGVSMTASAMVGTDAASGVAAWRVDYRFAELVDGTCGTWEPWSDGSGVSGFNGAAGNGSTVTLNIRVNDANADDVPDSQESMCLQLQLFTIDNVGNVATGLLSGVRRLDHGNPTTTLTLPTSGSGSGSVNVAGSATDAVAQAAPLYTLSGSGLDQVSVTYELPDGPDADSLPDASGDICTTSTFGGPWTAHTWSCPWSTSSLPDGTYTVRAVARDLAGRTSSVTTSTILLDNQAPVSAWHSWDDHGSSYLHATGTVAWLNPTAPVGSYALDARLTAYDLGSGMDRVDVPAFGTGWTPAAAGAATFTAPTPAANAWTRALTFTDPATLAVPGVLSATARDNAGNSSTVAFDVRFDGNAPTGGAAATTAGLQNTSSIAVALTGAVEPVLESGLASWTIQYEQTTLANDVCGTFAGVWSLAATGVGLAPSTYAHDVTTLPDGCYRYRVLTTDNVGNVGTSAASAARRVDRTLPTVTIAAPLSGTAQSGTFTVTGAAGDAHSGIDHVTLTWMGPGSTSGTICAAATLSGSSPTWGYTCSWNTSTLPDGSYTIRARSWDRAGTVSLNSDIVVLLDNQPPYLGFHSFTETSPYTYWAGPVGSNRSIWYNPTAPSGTYSFDVNVISYDLGSGVDRVEFAGAGTGWTPGTSPAADTSAASTPVANSYTATYTFDTANAGLVDPPTIGITAFDPANNPSITNFEAMPDNAAPNSGSLTYTNGYVPSTSVSVGIATGGDGSGSGVASWRLLRDSGTLSGGTCGAWTGYAPVVGASGTGAHTGTATDTVADGGCFRYRLETTDNVGNVGTVTASEVMRVDLTPPTGALVLAPNANPAGQHLDTPTRLFVNTNQAGSFDVDVTANAASGVLDVAFPTIATGFAPAFTQPGPGTTFTRTYTWTTGAGAPTPPQQVTVRSQSLGSLALPFQVIGDAAAPTGAGTTYASGFTSGTSTSVAFTPGTDGTGSGVASWQLQRDTGTLAAGACTWNNAWTAAGPASDTGPYVESPLAHATCYRYRVQSTDRVGNVATSTAGSAVMVDQTAPTGATMTLAAASNPTAQFQPAGDSVWINPNVGGSFTATVAATDAESGTGASTFPTLGSGWTMGGTGSMRTYTWSAGAVAPVSPSAVVANGSGLSTSVPFTVQLDGDAPAGATLDQEDGYITDFLVDTTFAGGADTGSGILSWRFERRSAPYDVGTDTCSPWGAWLPNPAPAGHPISPVADASVTQPNCYQYRLVETDRVGNVQYTLDGDTAKVIDDIFPPAPFTLTTPPTATLPAITTGATAPACGTAATFTTNTPVLDWSDSSDAESGLAGYQVFLDGSSTPLVTVAAPTSTWTASTLTDGAHTIGVRAIDNQSNYRNHTAPYPAAVRVDSAPPTAAASAPADLAWTTDTTPTLSWNATDANCVARVEVYVDDMTTPVAVASGSETSWTPTTALGEGTHQWRVEVIDGAGRRTSSTTRTVGIDTTAPNAFAITTPAGPTTVRGRIDVAWAASGDSGSGLAATAYTVYIDGIARATAPAGATTASINSVTNGAHTLEVRARDAVGNVTATSSLSFIGYPAILPPVLDAPAAGAAVNVPPMLDWHWNPDGGPAPTDYDVEVDGLVVGAVTHPTSELTIPDPGDGLHTWRIVQHDDYTGTVNSLTRTFLLDRTAPVAPATLTRVATTVSWAAASDPAAPVASGVRNVRFQIDGATVATLAPGATSYNYGSLPDGTYSMRVLVTDNAGNTTLSGALVVVNDSVPPTPFALDAPPALPTLPNISEGPTAPTCATAPTYASAAPALTWQASSDATSGLDGYTVLIDGAIVGTVPAGTQTFTPATPLSGGAHTWQVIARDVFGLTRASTPSPMNVRIDGAAPTVTLAAPAANAFTADTTPTLSWNGADDNCLARAEVTLDGAVEAVLSGPVSSWTPSSPLAEGPHTWSIRVFDSVGNVTASATRTVTIDTTAPTGITAIAPVDASTTPEGMLTFSWTAGSDGAGSGVASYDLQVDGTPRAANLTSPSHGTVAVYAGARTWRVRVVDQVGNAATFDFTFTASPVPDVTAPDPFDLLTPADASTVPNGTALTWAPAWDFKGVTQYRVYIDGALTGSTAGNVTSFTPAVGAGSAICTVDFDPATAASCVTSPQFSNGKTAGSATVLPSPASNSWSASSFPGWSSSGGAFGVGDPVANTGWDGDRTWTGMDYQMAVPAAGADLRFEHRYRTQRVGNNAYDGGALDIMVDTAGDGFANDAWASTCAYGTRAVYGASFDCTHEIVEVDGGFDAVLEGPATSSMPYRNVFSGDSGGMKQTRVRLDAFAGMNIRVRFRLGGDACYVGRSGCTTREPRPAIWHIDQLALANKSLLPGLHTWNVVAVDAAGNTRPSTQTWTFNLS